MTPREGGWHPEAREACGSRAVSTAVTVVRADVTSASDIAAIEPVVGSSTAAPTWHYVCGTNRLVAFGKVSRRGGQL